MSTSYVANSIGGLFIALMVIICIALIVIELIAFWKIFQKAGKPGWASIVPVYSWMVLAEIAWDNKFLGLLCLIPYAGQVFMLILYYKLAKRFGKGTGFAVLSIFFAAVTFPILAFSDAEYEG